jgi:NAD(P)-dependent dehydrogenase (short-subunit alcohol dehydrogenase family)
MPNALITGTSSGLGQSTVLELARRGWRVFATMRNLDRKGPLEEVLLAQGLRRHVVISQLDVTDPVSIRDAVETTLHQTHGHLDAVVHKPA